MIPSKSWWDHLPVSYWVNKPNLHTPLWQYFLSEIKHYSSLIDVGCGNGDICNYVDDYTGIDITKHLIEDNKTKHPTAKFACTNFLNFHSYAECVLCAHVIEHLPHFDAALCWCMEHAHKCVLLCTHTEFVNNTRICYNNGMFNNYYSMTDIARHVQHYGWKIDNHTILENNGYLCPTLKLVPAS